MQKIREFLQALPEKNSGTNGQLDKQTNGQTVGGYFIRFSFHGTVATQKPLVFAFLWKTMFCRGGLTTLIRWFLFKINAILV